MFAVDMVCKSQVVSKSVLSCVIVQMQQLAHALWANCYPTDDPSGSYRPACKPLHSLPTLHFLVTSVNYCCVQLHICVPSQSCCCVASICSSNTASNGAGSVAPYLQSADDAVGLHFMFVVPRY